MRVPSLGHRLLARVVPSLRDGLSNWLLVPHLSLSNWLLLPRWRQWLSYWLLVLQGPTMNHWLSKLLLALLAPSLRHGRLVPGMKRGLLHNLLVVLQANH